MYQSVIPLSHVFIRLYICIHSLSQSVIILSFDSCFHSSIHSFFHSFVYFIHSFIHLFFLFSGGGSFQDSPRCCYSRTISNSQYTGWCSSHRCWYPIRCSRTRNSKLFWLFGSSNSLCHVHDISSCMLINILRGINYSAFVSFFGFFLNTILLIHSVINTR